MSQAAPSPRYFAMVAPDGRVEKIVAILYGAGAIDAKDPWLKAVPVPTCAFTGGPVCAGWRYRDGAFYSPTDLEVRVPALETK